MEASLTGPGGQRTDITSNVLTIGRAPDNQLVLQDQQSSSHHAEIRPDAQGYLLVDMNSRNGTFVNEQRLVPQTPRLLISGDVIRIGETRFNYEIAGSNDEATMRANASEYVAPGYSPTVAVPPPSAMPGFNQPAPPDYMNYQQQAPAAPDFQQPAPPAYSGYQQPAPSAPNYPQANQPGYNQSPQAYPTPVYQPPQGFPQQAPWAGAPGQFGAPAAPVAARPRKRRTGLIVGLVVLLLLVVGGGSLYFFVIRSTPEKTLQAYCNAVQNSDAQGAFNQLSANAQSKTSVANFTKAFQLIKAAPFNGIKSCTYSNVQQNGSSATANMVLTLGNPAAPSTPTKVTLVNENGTWKLDTSRTTP
jgi:pSer/pThr/pTyr-binding forkhead associated (FHA) protein